MARYVVTAPVIIPFVSYLSPARVLKKGDVVDLSAAEVTAIGAGNLRATTTATVHDQLGMSVAVSNSSA
jgi:hypothetical protein